MILVLSPVILGFLTGTLPYNARVVTFVAAVTLFVLLILTSITRANAMFAGIGIVFTIAFPFVFGISAFVGLIFRNVVNEVSACLSR